MVFKSFRKGTLKCLVATNVAARGLDIPKVDLIIQLSPPRRADDYIHRSGRTGRVGKKGVCITFYTKAEEQYLSSIEFKAKIRFEKIGLPQIDDIMKANLKDLMISFDKVDDKVIEHFEQATDELIEKYGNK